jgi:hypothetical protein
LRYGDAEIGQLSFVDSTRNQMFRWFDEHGFKANIPELRRRFPETRLRTLEEWLRGEGWHKRARHVVPPKG